MLGLQRRRKVEGWAQTVSENEAMGAPVTLRQRIAEDNRLWLIALGAILIVAFWLITHAGQVPKDDLRLASSSVNSNYNDQAHNDFVQWFKKNKNYSASVIECRFAGPGNFRIVMPSDASADDVDYTSKMAAKLIEHKLHERDIVHTYFQKDSTRAIWRVASTKWDAKSYGYVIKFEDKP